MIGKFVTSVVFGVIAIFLTVYALAMTDVRTNPGGAGSQDVSSSDRGEKVSFISNTILVKLTAQARGKLKVVGEDVNPSATGLASLDVICRDFGVKEFRTITTSGVHRDPN